VIALLRGLALANIYKEALELGAEVKLAEAHMPSGKTEAE
jgi:hypothetical protein